MIPLRYIAVVLGMLLPLCVSAADECFDCHDRHRKTNHGGLDCIVCHNDAKSLPHPERLKRPDCASCHAAVERQHAASVHAGKNCRTCHTNVHVPRQETKKCLSCHPSAAHRTLPSARKHLASLKCEGCHAGNVEGRINIRLDSKQAFLRGTIDRDGNRYVDEKEWKDFLALTQSVVKDTYRIRRVYSAGGSAHTIGEKPVSCNGCHVENKVFRKAVIDVYAPGGQHLFADIDPHSVIPRLPLGDLYKLTPHGKAGVACRDCHVSQGRIDDSVCSQCHSKVYKVYKGTVHAKSSATSCTDCHDPHTVKAHRELGASERVAVCARCHSDYVTKHRWLPHTELHFMHLECSTCHSPLSEKGMVFTIIIGSEGKERKLAYDDVVRAFGSAGKTSDRIDVNRDGRVASSEIVGFFRALRKTRTETLTVAGSIVVTNVHHDYSRVEKRDKICATCHSDDAPFYKSMYLLVPEQRGFSYMPVKGTLLASTPASLGVNIMVLGETKAHWNDIKALWAARGHTRGEIALDLGFKWIDIAGIFLCLVTLFLVVIHIVLRVVFKR